MRRWMLDYCNLVGWKFVLKMQLKGTGQARRGHFDPKYIWHDKDTFKKLNLCNYLDLNSILQLFANGIALYAGFSLKWQTQFWGEGDISIVNALKVI